MRSRYYAPETGRFTTRDTWQGDYTKPLSLNRWNYAYSNPVNYTDPSGEIPVPVITAIIGGIVGGGGNYVYQGIRNQQAGASGANAWFHCIDWGDVAMWGAGGLVVGFALPFAPAAMSSITLTYLQYQTAIHAGLYGIGLIGEVGLVYDTVVNRDVESAAALGTMYSYGFSLIGNALNRVGNVQVFSKGGESWHLGLETKNNMNIIHVGKHPKFGTHIAFGSVKPFVADLHVYLQKTFPFFRIWRP